jgi:hypothetical protein
MNLQVEGRRQSKSPSEIEIRNRLTQLGTPGSTFAILTADDGKFLQAGGSQEDGFVLEFHDSVGQQHLQSVMRSHTLSTVVDAFIDFARGGVTWRSILEWVPWTEPPTRTQGATTWIGFAGVAVLVLGFFMFRPKVDQIFPYWFLVFTICSVVATWSDLRNWKLLDFRSKSYVGVSLLMFVMACIVTIHELFR